MTLTSSGTMTAGGPEAATARASASEQSPARHPLFLDLDGVLADFDAHVEQLFGARPSDLSLREMWARAASSPDFFGTVPMMADGMELWEFCRPFHPTILTGLPRGKWAEPQKRRWVAAHFGSDVPVITCMSRDKCNFAEPGSVLVDDRTEYAHLWEARGGIFVTHVSADATIATLRQLGFTTNDEGRPGS